MPDPVILISLVCEEINKSGLYQSFRQTLASEGYQPGAIAEFTGSVRADFIQNQRTEALYIEHYPGMTEKAMQKIVISAINRWRLSGVIISHRVGQIAVGEDIVYLAAAADHRAAAFEAVQFIMDFLKNDVPLWKKALTADDETWVDQKASDRARKKSWE